jgi:hypothetical protein
MFKKAESYEYPSLAHLALDLFLEMPLSAISRKEREAILNKISSIFKPDVGLNSSKTSQSRLAVVGDLGSQTNTDAPSLDSKVLALMIRLMELRNPTSELVRILNSSNTVFY